MAASTAIMPNAVLSQILGGLRWVWLLVPCPTPAGDATLRGSRRLPTPPGFGNEPRQVVRRSGRPWTSTTRNCNAVADPSYVRVVNYGWLLGCRFAPAGSERPPHMANTVS
jgi:hypothetical protein